VGVRTLAYIVTECRENAQQGSATQKLVIQHGGREVTAYERQFGPLPTLGLCAAFGYSRFGLFAAVGNPMQRLGISLDGSMVAFEVTDDHSIWTPLPPEVAVPPEEEGFFVVQADGSGLRRVGDASREPCARLALDPASPLGMNARSDCWRVFFSPDGGKIAFTDLGPDDTGQEATQIFTLDLQTHKRTQVTHLAPLPPPGPVAPTVEQGSFADADTLWFATNTMTDGSYWSTVKADGTAKPTPNVPRPPPVAVPGAQLTLELTITEPARGLLWFPQLGTPVNNIPLVAPTIWELFVERGELLLQLTAFRRSDTGGAAWLDVDEQRVVFTASANPLGTNPDENCQLFSIDSLGGDLRQLTQWGEGQHSLGGCASQLRPGCGITFGYIAEQQGPDTDMFYSTCDPLGTNPDGGQVFTVRSDGTGLRQLTHTRGVVTEADGTVTVELPGPYGALWDIEGGD